MTRSGNKPFLLPQFHVLSNGNARVVWAITATSGSSIQPSRSHLDRRAWNVQFTHFDYSVLKSSPLMIQCNHVQEPNGTGTAIHREMAKKSKKGDKA